MKLTLKEACADVQYITMMTRVTFLTKSTDDKFKLKVYLGEENHAIIVASMINPPHAKIGVTDMQQENTILKQGLNHNLIKRVTITDIDQNQPVLIQVQDKPLRKELRMNSSTLMKAPDLAHGAFSAREGTTSTQP